MLDRSPTDADAARVACFDRLLDGRWRRLHPSLVEGRGDVAVDRGMHPIGRVQQETKLGRDRHVIADEMAKRGRISTVGMHALRDLRQLVGVAQQDDRGGRAADGDHVGQRHLASLVDEEDIDRIEHVVAGEEPWRPGGDVVPTRTQVRDQRHPSWWPDRPYRARPRRRRSRSAGWPETVVRPRARRHRWHAAC